MADNFIDSYKDSEPMPTPPKSQDPVPPTTATNAPIRDIKPQDPAIEDLDYPEDEPLPELDEDPEFDDYDEEESMEQGNIADWRNRIPDDAPRPMRVALFFTGITKDPEARDIEAIIELVISQCAQLGLNWVWGATDEMNLEDVVDGSPLHQAIMERV